MPRAGAADDDALLARVLRAPAARRLELCDRLAPRLRACHLLRLIMLIEQPTRRTTRLSTSIASDRVRRAAAVALHRLAGASRVARGATLARLHHALGRSLALALPRRLATPRIVDAVLTPAECAMIVGEVRTHAARYGWGSLHRRYPTCDLPVNALPCGARVHAALEARTFGAFGELFGAAYGPARQLRFRDLFVAKYEARGSEQRGVGGHVDASLLSFVLPLNNDFDGGGTYFEHVRLLARPPVGSAVLFMGKVYHEGVAVTRGVRYVLVGLVDREGGDGPLATRHRPP